MKRIFGVLMLAAGLVFGSLALGEVLPATNLPLLTQMDFNIVGLALNASPDYQAVPKGIASQLNTAFDTGGFDISAISDHPPFMVVLALQKS